MTRFGIALLAGAVALLASGCTGEDPEPAAEPVVITSAATNPPSAPAESDPPAEPDAPPAGPESEPDGAAPADGTRTFRTSYPWGIPSEPVRISHVVRPPVAPPPAAPLPHLVEIRAADHPGEEPTYSRISFYFRGGFPSYELDYVGRVTAEGTGDTVPLPGNAFLRLRFIQAQAHDERGMWTITASPRPDLGYRNLRGYAFGGDFEGYLTYGLGLRVAPAGDQALPVRVLELTREDGVYVIAFDVRHG